MNILNFGSLNIDKVYEVDHLVRPGETIISRSFKECSGGKGLNQSIALASAGAEVHHAGKIGKDGLFLKTLLEKAGVDASRVDVIEGGIPNRCLFHKLRCVGHDACPVGETKHGR